ncbi:MAG: CgeB family protein [Bdellovibrionota bacterium]
MSSLIRDDYAKSLANGNYIDMISNIVVESIKEKPVDILICLAQAPITPKALTSLRQMGIITVLWFVEDYLRFTYWEQMAPFYDYIFTIQKDECIRAIKKAGCPSVFYLPVACDETVHKEQILSKEDIERWGSPISFFGAGYHNRQQFFATMCELPFKIWGTEWPKCKPFDRMVQEGGRRLTPEEYTKVFNATTININLHSSTECDGVEPDGDFVNPRTIELASSKAFQLVDRRTLLGEMFKEGEEIITYSSRDELLEKIDYYLNNEDARKEVIEKSYARAMKDHTYTSRIREMLSIIYSEKFEYLRERHENSAWQRMLRRAKPHKELYQRVLVAYERGDEATLDALVSDIVTGQGKLTDTEQKLLFLHHIKSQIIKLSGDDSRKRSA